MHLRRLRVVKKFRLAPKYLLSAQENLSMHHFEFMLYSENSHGIDDSRISGTIYTVVHKDRYRVEVSFYRPYDPSTGAGIPLNIDKR